MWIRSIARLAAMLSLVAATTTAQANDMHSFGRWMGIGWGDGYHSHYACPPRHSGAGRAQQKLPWWAIPASVGEGQSGAAHTFPPAGPSLFRQAGEGSSVIISDSPP